MQQRKRKEGRKSDRRIKTTLIFQQASPSSYFQAGGKFKRPISCYHLGRAWRQIYPFKSTHIYMTLTCNVNSIMLYGAVFTMSEAVQLIPDVYLRVSVN